MTLNCNLVVKCIPKQCVVFPMFQKRLVLECVLSLLSVLLSALILLALVNFSFWSDLYKHPPLLHPHPPTPQSSADSQTLRGIALGHFVSLLPLSALPIPLHSLSSERLLVFRASPPLRLFIALFRNAAAQPHSNIVLFNAARWRADGDAESPWEAKSANTTSCFWRMYLLE